MDFNFLGFEFTVSYWDQWKICVGIFTFLAIQWAWYEESLKVTATETEKGSEDLSWLGMGVLSILGVCAAAFVTPIVIAVLLWNLAFNYKEFKQGWYSFEKMQRAFFKRWCNTDYLAVFLPVACVLTLFLLD